MCFSNNVGAQTFLNGDFENNSAFGDQLTWSGDKVEFQEIAVYMVHGYDVSGLIYKLVENVSVLVLDMSKLSYGFYYVKTKTATLILFKE